MIGLRNCSLSVLTLAFIAVAGVAPPPALAAKPDPDQAIELLREGNNRFVAGESDHPNTGNDRLNQAGTENQGDHAYATVVTCSDSRVPVERVFDAGVMDIFVIRVAGNVCDVDEIGSIEYGVAHVNTPVTVILGHTQCGAVTAVTHAIHGEGHALERNIPPLVDNIEPAVHRAQTRHPGVHGDDIIPYAIEENVWQAVQDLFTESPAVREAHRSGKTRVVGAIYDVGTGEINWLPEGKVDNILSEVDQDPRRAMNAMAASGHGGKDGSSGHAQSGSGQGHSRAMASGGEHSQAAATSSDFAVELGIWDQWWFWGVLLILFFGGVVFTLRRANAGAMRLSVKAKLLGGFTTVILLLGLVSYIAESKMGQLGDNVDEVTQVYIPLTEKLMQVESHALQEELEFNGYLFDKNKERLTQFDEFSRDVDEELRQAERIIVAHAALKALGWEKKIKQLEEEHGQFVFHARDIIERAAKGERGRRFMEDVALVQHEGEDVVNHIDELLLGVEHALDSVAYSTAATEHAGFNLILVISVFAAIIGLAIAWLVASTLATQMSMLRMETEAMCGEFDVMSEVLEAIAANDLTRELPEWERRDLGITSRDEVGQVAGSLGMMVQSKDSMADSMRKMVKNLVGMIRELGANATQLVSASNEIASSSEQMSRGVNDQTEQINQVSSAMEEMSAAIVQASRNAGDASENAKGAADTAGAGGEIVSDTIAGMQRIADTVRSSAESISKLARSADQIGEIIGVIDDIADQTNLLALNAAIEAARAGEQGRGFAVVADEVRKLAERTGKATGEITDMIRGVQTDTEEAVGSMESGIQEVDKGRELADKAGNSLSEIVAMSGKLTGMVQQIATATEQQSSTAEQVSKNIEHINSVARETASGAEQAAAAAEQLNRQAEGMQQMVDRFRVTT
mgnify:CR=1 FL=1